MAQDLRDILVAIPLFVPFLLLPGYAAGYLLNVFAFRLQSLRTRLALSLALSFAVVPIAANLLARVISVRSCALLLFTASGLAVAGCVLFEVLRHGRRLPRASRRYGVGLIAILASVWVLVCLVSFPDLQIGHRLWNSVLIYDDGLRTAFIDAILRTGVPPHNPLFYFGGPVPSRYYYYWSTVCALPAALGHLPARAVLAASSVWTGFALAATIGLFLRFFLGIRTRLRRWTLLGTMLLAVTGLDLVPTAISWLVQGYVRADMEWWDGTEIPSWVDSILWTPHHIAGLLCCLTGLLLWPVSNVLSPAARRSGEPCDRHVARPAVHVTLAGVAFASAAGLSVYLAFCFGLFLAVWVARLLVRRAWRPAIPFLIACSLALLLSVPLLHDLRVPAAQQLDAHTGRQAHLITTGLRTSGWVKAHVPRTRVWRAPLLLLDLAATYVLEFGFFLLVLVVVAPRLWRRRARLDEAQIALCYLLGTALAVTTFLKSEAIQSNDLGMRAPLLAQWVLLLWAIPLLDGFLRQRRLVAAGGLRLLLGVTLLLGLCASLYQVVLLRLAAPLNALAAGHGRHPIAALPVSTDGQDVYRIRSAMAALTPLLAPGAVVAYNPFNEDRLLLLFDTRAQIAAATPHDCGTPFGGSPANCEQTKTLLRTIFGSGSAVIPPNRLDAACRAGAITILLVQNSDPVWTMPASWVWQRPALVANQSIRAVRCGAGVAR